MASRSLSDASPALVERYLLLAEDFAREQAPRSLIVTCTYRSVEEQQKLYAQGRTVPGKVVTKIDGVKIKGMHNFIPSRAIDVAVAVGGEIQWDEPLYHPLVELAARHGLVSGGSWPYFKDWPHIEGPPEMFA
jgi:peptidoglycan L-alanyl-D-glutamate endopeptidase CwlK